MISTPTKTKASPTHSLDPAQEASSRAGDGRSIAPLDLLGGRRLGYRELAAAAFLALLIDAFAGWSYLTSYFGYFRIPTAALDLTWPEVFMQGLRMLLLPVTVVIVAIIAPGRRLRASAIAVGVYVVFLAAASLVNHWASPGAVAVQVATSIVAAAIVFGMRVGFGDRLVERLLIGAAGLLLLISLPIASGTLDAGQTAGAKSTTLRMVTNSPTLPGAVVSAGEYTYSSYILLRESSTRYWVYRIGDTYAYSIAKSEVVYIRY